MENERKKVVIYIRNSSLDGEIEPQLNSCLKKLHEENLMLYKIYCDRKNRNNMKTLLEESNDGHFSHLIVGSLRRIERKGDKLQLIIEQLKKNNISIITVEEEELPDAMSLRILDRTSKILEEIEDNQIRRRNINRISIRNEGLDYDAN